MTKKLLVIDDDALMRNLLKLHLENAGYTVLIAEDAVEGGHLALSTMPDLVLMDVQMPFMSGYDLVAAMKADRATRHIPVIFLTTDDEVAKRSGRLGAEAYLLKPVNPKKLIEVVGFFT